MEVRSKVMKMKDAEKRLLCKSECGLRSGRTCENGSSCQRRGDGSARAHFYELFAMSVSSCFCSAFTSSIFVAAPMRPTIRCFSAVSASGDSFAAAAAAVNDDGCAYDVDSETAWL